MSKRRQLLVVLLLILLPISPASLAADFVHLTLPGGIEMDAPGDWVVLSRDQSELIADSAQAAVDLEKLEVDVAAARVLLAARAPFSDLYASLRVASANSPSLTDADFAGIARNGKIYEKDFKQMMARLLARQGGALIGNVNVHADRSAGMSRLITRYKRSGKDGAVNVAIIQFVDETREIIITLSYRESERGIWMPIMTKIEQSIVIVE